MGNVIPCANGTNIYKEKTSPFSAVEEEAESGKNMFCCDEENTELFPEVNKITNFVVWSLDMVDKLLTDTYHVY